MASVGMSDPSKAGLISRPEVEKLGGMGGYALGRKMGLRKSHAKFLGKIAGKGAGFGAAKGSALLRKKVLKMKMGGRVPRRGKGGRFVKG